MLLSPLCVSPFGIASGSTVFTINNSFLLDGVNEYFTIPNAALTPLLTGANKKFSIICLFRTNVAATYQNLFNIQNCLIFRINSATKLELVLFDGSVAKISNSNTLISTGSFHLGVVTYDYSQSLGNRCTFYLDTVSTKLSDTATSNIDTTASDTTLFASLTGSVSLNGYASMVSIVDKVLSPTEVIELYNSGKPKSPQTLFGSNCKFLFNPDNSGSTAQFTVTDSVNSINATSVNLEDANKTTTTPYV